MRKKLMSPYNKGQSSSAENPGRSKVMLWIRDVALPHAEGGCLIWPFPREPTGYASTVRNGKKIYIHRYICEIAHGEPPTQKHHAAHSCDNGPGGCVSPKHVSWKTNAENQLDHFRLRPRRGRFKLLPHQADEVRSLRGREHIKVTAARFGISVSHAKDIQTGRARSKSTLKLLTDGDVNAIRRAAMSQSDAKVAAVFGVKPNTIYRIRNGISYGHVPTIGAAP